MQDKDAFNSKVVEGLCSEWRIETIEKKLLKISKLLEEVQEEAKKEAEEPKVVEDKGSEDALKKGGEEAVEKVTLEVTKTQAETLTKFADMYINWRQYRGYLQRLANKWWMLEEIFKTKTITLWKLFRKCQNNQNRL